MPGEGRPKRKVQHVLPFAAFSKGRCAAAFNPVVQDRKMLAVMHQTHPFGYGIPADLFYAFLLMWREKHKELPEYFPLTHANLDEFLKQPGLWMEPSKSENILPRNVILLDKNTPVAVMTRWLFSNRCSIDDDGFADLQRLTWYAVYAPERLDEIDFSSSLSQHMRTLGERSRLITQPKYARPMDPRDIKQAHAALDILSGLERTPEAIREGLRQLVLQPTIRASGRGRNPTIQPSVDA